MAHFDLYVEDTTYYPEDYAQLNLWMLEFTTPFLTHVSFPPLSMPLTKPLILVTGRITEMGAGNEFDESTLPFTRSKVLTASEALSAGNVVNVWDNSGTVMVRKADATISGKEATGYVLDGVASSATVTVYFDDVLEGLSSLSPGNIYYLSTTAGGITTTAPSASGNVVQRVGRALSASEIAFEPGEPVVLA